MNNFMRSQGDNQEQRLLADSRYIETVAAKKSARDARISKFTARVSILAAMVVAIVATILLFKS